MALRLVLVLPLLSTAMAAVAGPNGWCPVLRCPSTSTCSAYRGSPICQCPTGQRFDSTGRCTSATIANSDWLDWQNNARAAVGLKPLVWDANLAAHAQSAVNTIGTTRRCPLVHPANLRQLGQGQNLAAGARSDGGTYAQLKWVVEGAMYTYSPAGGGCSTGKWLDCGHYTAIIWNGTTSVGCASAACVSGSWQKVFACNYYPGGNVIGRYPYRQDPCFPTVCPARATCDSSAGYAQCVCPRGQAVIRGVCARDICLGVSCPGNKVCNASTGTPTCQCSRGLVPSSSGSSTCIFPECLNVTCPSTSACAVTSNSAAYCKCPAGTWLQRSTCTSSPASVVVVTSVALNQGSANPLILRFSTLGQCVPLAAGFAVASYKIAWNATVSNSTTFPSGVTGRSCSQVQFWNKVRGTKCFGSSMGWSSSNGDIAKVASGAFAKAIALKCV